MKLKELKNLFIAGNLFDKALSSDEAKQLSALLDKFRAHVATVHREG